MRSFVFHIFVLILVRFLQKALLQKEAAAIYIRSPAYFKFLVELEIEAERVFSRAKDIDRRIKAVEVGIQRAREAVLHAVEEKEAGKAQAKKMEAKSGAAGAKSKSTSAGRKRGPLTAVERLREQLQEAEAEEASGKRGKGVSHSSTASWLLMGCCLDLGELFTKRNFVCFSYGLLVWAPAKV
jgi:hypothetical protein